MSHPIRISVGEFTLAAELNNSPTAEAILELLPLEAAGNRWGDEIYFSIPVDADAEEDAEAEVPVGALAFWPPGNAFCIFFGPTPASSGSTPCAASPVNVVGQVMDEVEVLRGVANGVRVELDGEVTTSSDR